jgi:predicted esterase
MPPQKEFGLNKLLVVLSHGKESGPLGTKIQTLMTVAKRHGAQVMSVDYREYPAGVVHDQNRAGEAERRVAQLLSIKLPEHERLVLVGSSMGGYVSTVASQHLKPGGLFLLAPAFYLPGYAQQDLVANAKRICVVHGWRDDVVPPVNSIRFAERHHADLYFPFQG